MSIKMAQPSLLLNSYAFNDLGCGCGLSMQTTWDCPKNTRCTDVVNWILHAWSHTPDKHLHNVVLNFHGRPGEILVGESFSGGMVRGTYVEAKYITIDLTNVGAFGTLKGKKIGTIWLHSCAVAKTYKGKYLCQRIAELSGCNVVAAEEDQTEWWGPVAKIFMPKDHIDDYEGQVYLWDRLGHMRPFSPNGGHWT